jgi:hypothetical protein
MANPYQAPLQDSEPQPVARRAAGPVGCGCAALAVLAVLLVVSTLLLSGNMKSSAPVVVPGPTPVPLPAPKTTRSSETP